MEDLKKGNTSINEHARRDLGITRDEYALCSYIHYRVADPKQKIRGYCCDKKEDIADFIGMSRAGVYKMIDRMVAQDLIDVDPVTGFFFSTSKWIRIENEGKAKRKQSGQKSAEGRVNKVDTNSDDSVNKVDTKPPKSVNLVTVNKEYDNKYDLKRESEKEKPLSPEVEEMLNGYTPLDALKEKKGSVAAEIPGPLSNGLYWNGVGPDENPISSSESVRASTSDDLYAKLREYYKQNLSYWNDGILKFADGGRYTESQQAEIVKDFCIHQIKEGRGLDSYSRHNAALQSWFRNEKYATWKKKDAPAAERRIKVYGS